MISVTLGFATATKCFSKAFHVVFGSRPPIQTLHVSGVSFNFARIFSSIGFFAAFANLPTLVFFVFASLPPFFAFDFFRQSVSLPPLRICQLWFSLSLPPCLLSSPSISFALPRACRSLPTCRPLGRHRQVPIHSALLQSQKRHPRFCKPL